MNTTLPPLTYPITALVPAVFYDDHRGRDLPSGEELHRSRRGVKVRLDEEAFVDLLDDARHYTAMGVAEFGRDCLGLVTSARATVKRLEAVVGEELYGAWLAALRDELMALPGEPATTEEQSRRVADEWSAWAKAHGLCCGCSRPKGRGRDGSPVCVECDEVAGAW